MARIFFMVFESAGPSHLIKTLRAAGHRVVVAEPKYPDFYNLLKQQIHPPEIFLVDCSRFPSQARGSSNYIRSLRAYRETPFLLYNVKPEDQAKALEKVPGATLLQGDDVPSALEALLRTAPRPPPGD